MKRTQRGSILIIAIVIVAVAILGVLGYVVWNNFLAPKTAQVTPSVTKDNTSAQTASKEKTFTSDKYGVTFTYPADWTVKEALADDHYDTLYVRGYTLQSPEGDSLSLSMGIQGIGGTCDASAIRSNNVIEAEPVGVKAQKPVTLSYIVYQDGEGYVAAYGLTDYYTEVKDSPSCPNTFYVLFSATNNKLSLVDFGGSKKFASSEEARQFKDSDTYKQYKKIISSLTYQD